MFDDSNNKKGDQWEAEDLEHKKGKENTRRTSNRTEADERHKPVWELRWFARELKYIFDCNTDLNSNEQQVFVWITTQTRVLNHICYSIHRMVKEQKYLQQNSWRTKKQMGKRELITCSISQQAQRKNEFL
jgi:hypothetical protein